MPDTLVSVTASDATTRDGPPRRSEGRPLSFVHITQLSDLLAEARRYPQGVARADLCETLTMGRNAVDRRIKTALGLGLLMPAGRGESTGGRAPEMWRFNPAAGTVLVLAVSYRYSVAALMDLDGAVVERIRWEEGILTPPDVLARHALQHLTALKDLGDSRPELPDVWGLGISVPVPVDFRDGTLVPPVTDHATGRATDYPEQVSWTSFPLRRWFAERMRIATWIDDEVNVMALAAATRIGAPQDLLYIRLSLGLGMGIVSRGQVHRGAGAASGEIAHIQMAGTSGVLCRCGRHGCLETLISGGAMEREATAPQALRSSSYLRAAREGRGAVHESDVFQGVAERDRVCLRIVTEAADRLSVVLAVLCTTYNPGEIVLGGEVTASGRFFAQVVDQAVRRRVLPTTSERLRVRMCSADDALIGACRLVAERMLSAHVMHVWLPQGSPAGVLELVTHRRQDA